MKTATTAFAVFRLLDTPGIGPAKVREALDFARTRGASLDELLADPRSLAPIVREGQLGALQSRRDRAFEIWEKLQAQGVDALSIEDEPYPKLLVSRLGRQAPPLLFVRGNRELLAAPSLGFCGSRHASEKGLAVARACADLVAREGINVASGYAVGVDLATHRAALEEGGTTTVVLAEGILHFRVKREVKDLWDWNRALVLSEHLPNVPWSVQNAMRRNSTICAACRAMVLIEARETGGSFEAGRACLKLGVPLFAPVYEGMPESAVGNRILLTQGARPFKKNRTANAPNLRQVMDVLRAPTADAGSRSELEMDAPRQQVPLFN